MVNAVRTITVRACLNWCAHLFGARPLAASFVF
jgi:hypothetical protein